MKKILLILLLLNTFSLAQNFSDSLKSIEDSFKSFRYAEVIKKTPSILMYGNFSSDTLINIYMMKGISHYALQEDTLAKYSFYEILKINPDYSPDSISISPKIVTFFSAVKTQFTKPPINDSQDVKDTVIQIIPDMDSYAAYSEKVKGTMVRSLLFPGFGHIYADDSKGWFITSAAGLALASTIYFSIDAGAKRDDYLNETDPSKLNSKYNDYNNSYKARNFSIIALAAIWLYAQVDLLTSSALDFSPETIMVNQNSETTFLSFRFRL